MRRICMLSDFWSQKFISLSSPLHLQRNLLMTENKLIMIKRNVGHYSLSKNLADSQGIFFCCRASEMYPVFYTRVIMFFKWVGECVYTCTSRIMCFTIVLKACFFDTDLASSHSWKALSRAAWSLCRDPAKDLCTQPKRLRSICVTKGSWNVVLAAIVHIASPMLQHKVWVHHESLQCCHHFFLDISLFPT